jgi:hypothetical protein
MTQVQENETRSRWFRRGTGSHTEPGATPTGTTQPGTTPSGRHAATEQVPPAGPPPLPGRDPGIGHRRKLAAQARLRDRFGGRKVGAAFFGWLVAIGMTVLLTTLATALGVAIGTSMGLDPAGADAAPIGLTGGAVLLAVLAISYFTGGYVAGRLARFDGASNGILTWVIGLLVTVLTVVGGMVFGTARSDLLDDVTLPTVPGDWSQLTVAGVVVLAVVLLVTALAAALGGRLGERFHRRVDRAAEVM